MPEVIYFSKLRGPYRCLPNFAPTPIEIAGVVWATSEHFYQAQKFTDVSVQDQIATAATAYDAAHRARAMADHVRADWHEIKLAVMLTALRAKANQHADVKKTLIDSGDAALVEQSPKDNFWGNGPDGNGQNYLGRLWMQVREELRGEVPVSDVWKHDIHLR